MLLDATHKQRESEDSQKNKNDLGETLPVKNPAYANADKIAATCACHPDDTEFQQIHRVHAGHQLRGNRKYRRYGKNHAHVSTSFIGLPTSQKDIDAQRGPHKRNRSIDKTAGCAGQQTCKQRLGQLIWRFTVYAVELQYNKHAEQCAHHQLESLHRNNLQRHIAEEYAGNHADKQIAHLAPHAPFSVKIRQLSTIKKADEKAYNNGVGRSDDPGKERHGRHDGTHAGGTSNGAADYPAQKNKTICHDIYNNLKEKLRICPKCSKTPPAALFPLPGKNRGPCPLSRDFYGVLRAVHAAQKTGLTILPIHNFRRFLTGPQDIHGAYLFACAAITDLPNFY